MNNIILSSLLGIMLFFSIVITPSAFKVLSEENVALLLRNLFPKVFLTGIVISFLSLLIAFFEKNLLVTYLTLIILTGFIFNRFYLVNKINEARDQEKDQKKNKSKKFQRLHNFSVLIYLVQIILVIYIIFSEY